MSGLEIAAVGLQGVGTLANAWVQWYALKEGRIENRKTRALQKEMWERSERIRTKERREDVAFEKEKFREDKSFNKFKKRQAFLDTTLSQFNSNPQMKNNFIMAQRGRQ